MPAWVTADVTGGPAARYVPAADSSLRPAAPVARGPLPRAEKVLAVIARPGQESVDLGALLYAFRKAGASLALLCVTRGEASPLNSTCERLETRRPWELLVAGTVIGISSVTVADYPDGGLTRIPLAELTELASREIRRHAPDLLLVVDPVAHANGSARPGHDEAVVARAVRAAATMADVPVAAIVAAGAHSGWLIDLGTDPATARAVQRSAVAAHVSQGEARPEVERRLGLLGGRETLRWLVPAPRPSVLGPLGPAPGPTPRSWPAGPAPGLAARTLSSSSQRPRFLDRLLLFIAPAIRSPNLDGYVHTKPMKS